MILKIKNDTDIIEEFTDILMDFDKIRNQYQTDVYLYYDNDTQTARLELFENIGGNSWKDDDHYVLYRDKAHYDDDFTFYFDSVSSIAERLDLEENKLLEMVEKKMEIQNADYSDICTYIKSDKACMDKMEEAVCNLIDNSRTEYFEQAENIFRDFIKEKTLDEHEKE